MAQTIQSDMLDPQILVEAVRGRFKQKTAFMGSILAAQGAVRISGSMPKGGPGAVGKTVEIPYFGTIGEFVNNADGSSVTPSKIAQQTETATVARQSLAGEISAWAQGIGQVDPAIGDPYQESADQIMVAGTRAMDKLIIAEFATTPLVLDIYSATTPGFLSWDTMIDAKTLWGDEQDAIVGAVAHSQAQADMAKLKDSAGRPLLLLNQTLGNESVDRFGGVPLVTSDRAPLTGSTMGTVTSAGTSPPVATLVVDDATKMGPWKLSIDCVVGGAHETATYRFSTDGGNTWSANLTTLGVGVAQALVDTAVDSLVGNNGQTGLTVAFAAGTFNADNTWKAQANLKVSTLICQQDAGAFWYNSSRFGMKSDVDILADTDVIAMHLYHATKLYRRRRGGSRPGVVAIKHNVKGYVGTVTF
jgi:hypothetical protein